MHNSYQQHQRSRISFGYYILFSIIQIVVAILAMTYYFWTIDRLLLSYFTLLRSKLEYTLQAWNIANTNVSKLECVKWKFAALSLRLFCFSYYSHACALELLSYTLYKWQGITLMLFFLLMFFQDLNFILPWVIILVYIYYNTSLYIL
jgi:hypothetical protein